MLMLPDRQIFICDTYVNRHPTAVEIAEMTLLAAEEMRRFGLTPVAALLSHSSFGSSEAPEAQVMREARAILLEHDPDLVVEGEMQGDAALSKTVLDRHVPRLAPRDRGEPADHAERRCGQHRLQPAQGRRPATASRSGPILLGAAKPVHILEPGVTVRRIVNMTALATVDASMQRQHRSDFA